MPNINGYDDWLREQDRLLREQLRQFQRNAFFAPYGTADYTIDQLRVNQNQVMEPDVIEGPVDEGVVEIIDRVKTKKKKDTLEDRMKKRHLDRHERAQHHKPAPDWIQTGKGEVCRSASTLPIDDLVTEFKLV